MRRRLFALAAAASAVLCVVVIALYAGPTHVWRPTAYLCRYRGARTHQSIERDHRWIIFRQAPADIVPAVSAIPPTQTLDFRRWTFLECEFRRLRLPNGETARSLWVPYQIPMLASAVLPIAWLISRTRQATLRRQRRRQGKCAHCGYDLRASPGRCPECGASAAGSLALRTPQSQ